MKNCIHILDGNFHIYSALFNNRNNRIATKSKEFHTELLQLKFKCKSETILRNYEYGNIKKMFYYQNQFNRNICLDNLKNSVVFLNILGSIATRCDAFNLYEILLYTYVFKLKSSFIIRF